MGEPDFSPLFHVCVKTNTVEPVLSAVGCQSPEICTPLITVIFTSVKRSPLLSDRGHPLLIPNGLFVLYPHLD